MEEVLSSSSKSKSGQAAAAAATTAGERKPRPRPEQKVECPRCKSGNTKFCYYNNYSMSQPRYFCKACRRYWTHGGSLRNVPIGGGCRKSKRPAASSDVQNKIDVASSSSEPPPMGTASACAGMMDFSNVLPAFMSGFELPGSLSLATFVSPSSSNPAAASGGMASFLDVLRGGAGGVHDGGHGQNNGYYYGAPAAGSGIGMLMTPPATSFGIAGALQQQHGGFETGGNGIGGATGTTFQGGEGDSSMRGMMGLQWQPQFGTANMGTANGGGGVGSQQMNTVNNNATTENNNNNNNGGGGGGEDDGGGSSRDYYWINNGGSSNPWQNLINSNSLM